MASLTHLLSIAVVFLGLLSISATARPCKTLLISSYSITFKPTFHRQNRNFFYLDKPNPSSVRQEDSEPEGFITIFTSSSSSSSSRIFIDRHNFPAVNQFPQFRPAREEDDASFGLFNSLRDRTKDVLSVVVALLFGVGCGAFTGGTMYLAYSLVRASYSNRSLNYYDSDDEDEDITPKKCGYVTIPSAADATPPKQVDIAIQPLVTKIDHLQG